jgi:hypothetical protein
MVAQPSPRRRFQFSLWTLFVAVAIVAVQCAVCLPILKEWQDRQQIKRIAEAMGLYTAMREIVAPPIRDRPPTEFRESYVFP